MINLAHYAVGGSGESSAAEMAELQKAMTAGTQTGRETAGVLNTGQSLKVESLENTLRSLTFKESDIKMWKMIPKLPAFNTVEEYNMLVEYGEGGNSFTNEGELGEESDTKYIRSAQHVKYMSRVKAITHPMQLVNVMGGDVTQNQVKAGTLEMLRDVNQAIIYGDSNVVSQQFNGIFKQQKDAFSTLEQWYTSEVVVDCKGKTLKDIQVEQAALALVENHAEGSLLMAPPSVLSGFNEQYKESKRIQTGGAGVTNTGGLQTNTFLSQFGQINLDYDKFLTSSLPKTTLKAATSSKAPAAPIADATTPKALVTDATTKFGGFLGDYYYAVAAINRFGESALTVLGNAKINVTAGNSVSLKFTSGGGANPATGYKIYRTEANPVGTAADATYYPLYSVSANELANGHDVIGTTSPAGTVLDKNRFVANTENAFLIEPTQEVFSFKQLAPLMKMDLAINGPASRFTILLYGTPIVYAPKKFVRFINIGKSL